MKDEQMKKMIEDLQTFKQKGSRRHSKNIEKKNSIKPQNVTAI